MQFHQIRVQDFLPQAPFDQLSVICAYMQTRDLIEDRTGCSDLSRAGFVAPLPTQLAFLTKLVTLNLSFNSFSGALPASWGDQSFGNLQTLDLTSNRLTQTLPAAWGRTDGFPNLTSLQLRNNQISGSLPSTWANARANTAVV
jgi:Leucine-rich repeat (LRR) protein